MWGATRFLLFPKAILVLSTLILFAGCGGGGGGTNEQSITSEGYVSHLAGPLGGPGIADGTGADARFNSPRSIVTDGTNLYVADCANHTIRKIEIETGAVTTLVGSAGVQGSQDGTFSAARFKGPHGLAMHGTTLYVTDAGNCTIRKIDLASGVVTTLAGLAGQQGYQDGVGNEARFDYPYGIATDGTHLYVADTYNSRIRKVVIATGEVTTMAGSGSLGSDDGIGTSASFGYIFGIEADGTNLYVTDCLFPTIRKVVISTGEVTTIAGSAEEGWYLDGIGADARFDLPVGMVTDGTSLYVADNNTIRKIDIATRSVTTLAGTGGASGFQDGTGSDARFYSIWGITTDGNNLYVTDYQNNTIRKVVIASRVVMTLAGLAAGPGFQDGTSAAASFDDPHGITAVGTDVYVTDSQNNTIRKIDTVSGAVTTFAGSTEGYSGSNDGTGTEAYFSWPIGIATDGTNLYVVDSGNNTIRKIDISTRVVSTLAGTADTFGSDDGVGAAARFNTPLGIVKEGANLYVTDGQNSTVRKIDIITRSVTTLAGSAGHGGYEDGVGTEARFANPVGIASDGVHLYVVDSNISSIRKIDLSTRTVTTIAGVWNYSGSADGVGSAARFNCPWGITIKGTSLYVTDSWNYTIRVIDTLTNQVTTLTGTAGFNGSVDGTLSQARLIRPMGIIWSGSDSCFYVCDGNAIRKVVP